VQASRSLYSLNIAVGKPLLRALNINRNLLRTNDSGREADIRNNTELLGTLGKHRHICRLMDKISDLELGSIGLLIHTVVRGLPG
jgi:hypothetical protein